MTSIKKLPFLIPARNLLLVACTCLSLPSLAQDIPRTDAGIPFLQGIWQAQSRAAWNLEGHVARHDMPAGLSVVEGGTIPTRPGPGKNSRPILPIAPSSTR